MTPSIGGHFYYIVDINYVSLSGEIIDQFETTLEIVVEGSENHYNHKIHQQNGYEHGLGDHLNPAEQHDFVRFMIILCFSVSALVGFFICL